MSAVTLGRLLGSFGLLCFSAILGAAEASPIVTLPNAVSYWYFGLNFANNIQTSTTVGTLDYNGQPGCGGTCTATTQLGTSPSDSATVNEVVYRNTSGGGVIAQLGVLCRVPERSGHVQCKPARD